jgi:dephospho-CoA kinase
MIICITGCYGSGKTTLARYLGFRTISADKLGKETFEEKKEEIKKLFGTSDKAKIREKIFSDRKSLIKFNKIIHPSLIRKLKETIAKYRSKNMSIDAALYYDLKIEKICDRIIIIKRDSSKIARTLNKPKKEILKIIRNQRIPTKADFVIINNGSKKELKRKAMDIRNKLFLQKGF